jgi:hypothetical protein
MLLDAMNEEVIRVQLVRHDQIKSPDHDAQCGERAARVNLRSSVP